MHDVSSASSRARAGLALRPPLLSSRVRAAAAARPLLATTLPGPARLAAFAEVGRRLSAQNCGRKRPLVVVAAAAASFPASGGRADLDSPQSNDGDPSRQLPWLVLLLRAAVGNAASTCDAAVAWLRHLLASAAAAAAAAAAARLGAAAPPLLPRLATLTAAGVAAPGGSPLTDDAEAEAAMLEDVQLVLERDAEDEAEQAAAEAGAQAAAALEHGTALEGRAAERGAAETGAAALALPADVFAVADGRASVAAAANARLELGRQQRQQQQQQQQQQQRQPQPQRPPQIKPLRSGAAPPPAAAAAAGAAPASSDKQQGVAAEVDGDGAARAPSGSQRHPQQHPRQHPRLAPTSPPAFSSRPPLPAVILRRARLARRAASPTGFLTAAAAAPSCPTRAPAGTA